jgi:glutamate 5-kinase
LIHPTQKSSLAGRKVWLGSGARPVGRVICDAGAVKAVQATGASLLAKGVQQVDGDFAEGSVVELVGPSGDAFARGVTVYAAGDLRRIAGRHSHEIEPILGFKILDEVIHRDNMVIL